MEYTVTGPIAYNLATTQKLLHAMIDTLKPDELTKHSIDGLNNIAWIMTHLAVVDRRALTLLEAKLPELPQGFDPQIFLPTGKPPENQNNFDAKSAIALFDEHRKCLIEAVTKATNEQLDKPVESRSGLFKTLGEMVTFFSSHTAMHAGQISAMRRAMGYPALF